MKKAIVSGSYDPFTFGHLNIVKQASEIFVNSNKKRHFDTQKMVEAIKATLKRENINNCVVAYDTGLLAKYCENNNINFTIRGLRNNMDYNYEENISEVNKLINPNLKSIYLRADNVGISSSMVRELFSYGEEVSKYVPKEILAIMKKDTDFHDAFNYLSNHIIFADRFNECLDIEVVKINPKTKSIDDNAALNTETEIWLECGPYYNGITHDVDLDCGGKTFEEAIINLRNLVEKKYGNKNQIEIVENQYK